MPIYEYQCDACLGHHEALQKITDEPLTVCPECHQPQLRKLVSAAGFELKGTGWYVTDFRDKKPSAPPSNSSEQPSTASSSTSESKSDSVTASSPSSSDQKTGANT